MSLGSPNRKRAELFNLFGGKMFGKLFMATFNRSAGLVASSTTNLRED